MLRHVCISFSINVVSDVRYHTVGLWMLHGNNKRCSKMEAFTAKRVTRKPFTYNMCYCVRAYIEKIKVFNRVALVRKNLPQHISI